MNWLIFDSVEPSQCISNAGWARGLSGNYGAFDLTGSLDSHHSDVARLVGSEGDAAIIGWLSRSCQNDMTSEVRNEYIDWLSEMPNKVFTRGRNLKSSFTYAGNLSLWWLTRLSQKKHSKSPLLTYFERIIVLRRLIAEYDHGSDDRKDELKRVVIVGSRSDTRDVVKTFLQCSYPDTNIKFHLLTDGSENTGRSVVFSALDHSATSLRRCRNRCEEFLKCMKGFLGTCLRIIGTNRWLSHIGRSGAKQTLDFIFLSYSQTDFEEYSLIGESDRKVRNRYYGLFDERLQERGYTIRWICLDNNKLMTGNRYRHSLKLFEHSYEGLFPGWKAVMSLILTNIFWIVRFFLIGRCRWSQPYAGVDFGDLVRQDYLLQISGNAFELLYLRRCMESLCKRYNGVFVLHNKPFNSIGRALQSMNVKGARVLGVQAGIVDRSQLGYLYRKDEVGTKGDALYIDKCPVPDRILVHGPRIYQFMTNAGYPAERIWCIGSIRHDYIIEELGVYQRLSNRSVPSVETVKKDLNLHRTGSIVLICTQWPRDAHAWLAMTVRSLENVPYAPTIVVKPHPHLVDETVSILRQKAADIHSDRWMVSTDGLYKLLYVADVMVTGSSTTGLEGLLLGTPLINIESGIKNADDSVYRDFSVSEIVTNDREMASALEQYLEGRYDRDFWESARRRFLNYNLSNLERPAFELFLELISRETRLAAT